MLFPIDTKYNSRDLHSNMDMQLFSIKVFVHLCVSSLVLILSKEEKANNASFASVKIFGLGILGNPLRLLRGAGGFYFFILIIYHFYCRYPPPIRSNERDPRTRCRHSSEQKGRISELPSSEVSPWPP